MHVITFFYQSLKKKWLFLTEAVPSKWGKEVKYYLGTTKEYVPSVCIRFQIFVGK